MSFEAVRKMIASAAAVSPSARELAAVLEAEVCAESDGRLGGTAGELRRTFEVRKISTERAGIWTCGMAETLRGLARLPDDERIALFNFVGQTKHFSAFVSAHGELVGVIGVVKPQPIDPASLPPWIGRRDK